MSSLGFPIVSVKTAFVSSSMWFAIFCGWGSVNFTFIPNLLGNVWSSSVIVPPYSSVEATMLSPFPVIVNKDKVVAACPEAVAAAASPFSRSVIFCSNAS